MIKEKITPQELADKMQAFIAMDEDGEWYAYETKPEKRGDLWHTYEPAVILDAYNIQFYSSNWRLSLATPKGQYYGNELIMVWTKHNPFAQARHFVSYVGECVKVKCVSDNPTNATRQFRNHATFDKDLIEKPVHEWPKEKREMEPANCSYCGQEVRI